MTKPVPTGKRYAEAFEILEEIARQGGKEALTGLYFIIGDDKDAAIAQQKTVIELLALLTRAMAGLSRHQIHTVLALLNEENEREDK